MQLNLTANTSAEQRILDYLQENVSETLAEKINQGTPLEKDGKTLVNKKTLASFMKYACEEARKLAEKNANSACVEDNVVFGWAIHYFEEESIEGTLYNEDGTPYSPAKKATQSKPTPPPKPKKEEKPLLSLFDLMESETVEEPAEEDTDDVEETANMEEESKVEESKPNISPIYSKYLDYEKQKPNAIVTYRLGDFYEVFGEKATTLANELSLTLTGRDFGLESRIPMVGFPYHASENYFNKIVEKHDLYIIENESEKRFIQKVPDFSKNLIDKTTGEILDKVIEPQDGFLQELYDIFGEQLEVKQ